MAKQFKFASELIRMSLIYAIQDRESFAQCYQPGAPERDEANAEAKEFRAYLKKRFHVRPGGDRIDAGPTISIDELRRRHEAES